MSFEKQFCGLKMYVRYYSAEADLNNLTLYRQRTNDTISLMYTGLSSCDMLAGVAAILNGVALLYLDHPRLVV